MAIMERVVIIIGEETSGFWGKIKIAVLGIYITQIKMQWRLIE